MGDGAKRDIIVIGGGINGVCAAHALAGDGHRVTLLERDTLMQHTSRNSSKLLHGGLRYLETGSFRLVHEALHERAWWLRACPQYTRPLPILLPVYADGSRSPLLIGAGILLYHLLAGRHHVGPSRWLCKDALARAAPHLKRDGLRGGFLFHDGQMDDHALGLWMAEQARTIGVDIAEHRHVTAIDTQGNVTVAGARQRADLVVNATGPWAELLLRQSGLDAAHGIDWVRGSHLVFGQPCEQAFLLPVPGERRIFFVLPYQGRTLVGTTEVPQSTAEPIVPSDAEIDYLLAAWNHYFEDRRSRADVVDTYCGVRPLLHYSGASSAASREYAIDRDGRLITIYGGKWTTAHALGQRVARMVREAPPPRR